MFEIFVKELHKSKKFDLNQNADLDMK